MFVPNLGGPVRWPDEPPEGVEPVTVSPEVVTMDGVTYVLIPALVGLETEGQRVWAEVRSVAFLNDDLGEWRPTGFILAASSEEEAMPKLRELVLMVRERLGEMGLGGRNAGGGGAGGAG